MGNSSRQISRGKGFLAALVLLASLCLAGCHDWPDERVTAIEAQNILRDLGRIEMIPDANVAYPDIYKTPPKKIRQTVAVLNAICG